MSSFNRRSFLKRSGVGILPAIIPFSSVFANSTKYQKKPVPSPSMIKFYGDGEMFEPGDYLQQLQNEHSRNPIIPDRYGNGGAITTLEKKFAELTGKEKAIFMPTGTMANQLAVSVLSGDNTKVFVQDTSHYFRDEADAAQSVFGKRLVPLAKDETFFTARQLRDAIEQMPSEEVFPSGVGAVSIENPVRRTEGGIVPIEEIEKISDYCRSKNIRLHLDGARIFMASAWTGIPIKEYSKHFDTVYISLYKYLGSSAGAILCGDKAMIEKMPHLMKIHGGAMFGNWVNAAMALNRLEGFEDRLKKAIQVSKEIFNNLNKLDGIKIEHVPGGSNIYRVLLSKDIDGKNLQERLRNEFEIIIPRANEKNQTRFSVNETLLYKSTDYIIEAFKKAIS